MRKVSNVFAFFKSTLPISIAVSLFPLYIGGWSSFVFTFITFGFIVSLAIKEVYNKTNYIFYFNNGLSKVQLWLFSYLMNVIFAVALTCLVIILRRLF